MNPNRFEHNKFKYYALIDEKEEKIYFSVDSSKTEPEFLYKYYPLNYYSIDSLLNNYLFASHPMQLNDKYDCASELIDYSEITIDYFKNVFNGTGFFSTLEIDELYYSDKKWILERKFGDLEKFRLYMNFGIISLTTTPDSPTMWAYYAQNSGFVVKFKTSILSKKAYCLFPINYTDNFKQMSWKEYAPELHILYQTNIKSEKWINEDEWRVLTYSQFGSYHPKLNPGDVKSRYYFYPLNTIEEIIFGYDFIDLDEVDRRYSTSKKIHINLNKKRIKSLKKNKRQLLNFIVKNSIKCKEIVRNTGLYNLEARDIKIEQLSPNKFIFYRL